jgi:hypothetical protein
MDMCEKAKRINPVHKEWFTAKAVALLSVPQPSKYILLQR